jgi:curved DNA-binding protein CbpA
MMSVVTWYDVLGVVPGATPDDIREAWQARQAALQPGSLAGAPAQVLSAADRARQAVDEAWRVLADPAAREAYDQGVGFHRPGEGLGPPSETPAEPDVSLSKGWSLADEEALESYPSDRSHVVVPNLAGLFYHVCMDVADRVGLHLDPVRLTAHPMPVEGLVVGQQPDAGRRVHRDSTLTVQLWHPPEPDGQPDGPGAGHP